MKKKQQGFTLLELLVVIAIVALLTVMALVALDYVKARGRDTKRVANISEIHKALAIYYTQHEAYPLVPNEICLNGQTDDLTTTLNNSGVGLTPIADPLWPNIHPNDADPGQGHCYTYISQDGLDYELRYFLELNAVGNRGENTETP